MVARGEIAWLELEEEGRRPVVVLTRHEALPPLHNVVVALVTRIIRGLDTEVQLGPAHGMPVECAVRLDNLRTVRQTLLTEGITRLDAIWKVRHSREPPAADQPAVRRRSGGGEPAGGKTNAVVT